MTPLHPHWQTTDDEAQDVPVRASGGRQFPDSVPTPRARRSPAAFIGVALFLLIGLAVFTSTDGFMGQVVPANATITLTDDAVDPEEITVAQGEIIIWQNMGGIPHVLSSDTLPTDDGEPFESTAIFPNATFEYTVPAAAEPGVYEYMSQTSLTVAGSIIIEEVTTASATDAQNAPASMQEETPETPPPAMGEEPVEQPLVNAEATHEESTTTDVETDIPVNPHTIASDPTPATRTQTSNQVLHSGAPSTAETGIGLWMTVAIVLLALIGVVRLASKS